MTEPSLPKVVSQEEWQRAVDQLRVKEKEVTRATDAMAHPAHLNARDTSLVLISRAPLAKLLDYRNRMGSDLPWHSSIGSKLNVDMGATIGNGENHMTSVFIREKNQVYRTYYTDNRGVEYLGSHWTNLDLTTFDRQEPWDDSPEGRPKGK